MDKDYFDLWGIKIPNKYFEYLLISIIPIFILWYVFTNYWGYEEIGKFGEKRNYTTQYWVYLKPENTEAKEYHVKADIERSIPDYYLLKVYWPNGGHSDFDDCPLTINDEIEYMSDDIYCRPNGEENGYYINLDKKVE